MNCFWTDFVTFYVYLQCTIFEIFVSAQEIGDCLERIHSIEKFFFHELEYAIDEEDTTIFVEQIVLETGEFVFKFG